MEPGARNWKCTEEGGRSGSPARGSKVVKKAEKEAMEEAHGGTFILSRFDRGRQDKRQGRGYGRDAEAEHACSNELWDL